MRSSSLALPALAGIAFAAKHSNLAANNPDDPTGKLLYVTEPACGFYQCSVTWPVGSPVAVNWLGPPPGNVSVSLASNVGGPTYLIVDSIAATSQEGYCDSGYGLGVVAPGHECGRVEFVVPEGWQKMDNYTIVVQSLSDQSLAGYTDRITIAAENSTLTVPNPPSGTEARLLTIAAPTATNAGASTSYDGQIPAPTAVTGDAAAASSTAADASSSATVTGRSSAGASASTNAHSSASSAVSGTRSASSAAASESVTGAAPAGALIAKTAAALGAVAAVAVLAL
ncbi:hypothetical protein JCM10213_006765 [Rhodosporidiobolus nylandii]